tara:strand:- start:44 stop:439 length:396 start_codon:yes stop_codon:yes gene_type:complete
MVIQPKNSNLTEITTPIQAKRGNRQFFDKKHKVSYISYSSGYVRREVKALCTSPYNNTTYKTKDQFVINKRDYERKSWTNRYGQLTTYTSTKIIKEPCPQARMDIIDHHSTNYKGYTGRFARYGNCKLIAK